MISRYQSTHEFIVARTSPLKIDMPQCPPHLARHIPQLTMSTITTSLEAKHHHSASSTSTTATAERTIVRDTEEQSVQPSISHLDRDSAIALGVILILILAAIAWYVRLHIKTRRQADEERALERRDGIGRGDALRRYGARARAADPKFRMDRMWSQDSRQDSVSTLNGSTSTEGRNNRKVSESTSRASSTTAPARVGSGDGSIASHTTDQEPHHARSRSPSPHSISGKSSLDQSLPRSRHRRQSSISNASLAEVQLHRPPALSQAQFDRRWWTEVARRGSAARVHRHFSVMEPISEPGTSMVHEVAVHDQQRRRSEAGWRGNRLPTATCSRSEYDWTRPSAVASEGVENGLVGSPRAKLDEFNSVVWDDQGSKQTQDGNTEIKHPGTHSKSEGIERVDWATDTQDSPGPAC
jgi:hypothetical protein